MVFQLGRLFGASIPLGSASTIFALPQTVKKTTFGIEYVFRGRTPNEDVTVYAPAYHFISDERGDSLVSPFTDPPDWEAAEGRVVAGTNQSRSHGLFGIVSLIPNQSQSLLTRCPLKMASSQNWFNTMVVGTFDKPGDPFVRLVQLSWESRTLPPFVA